MKKILLILTLTTLIFACKKEEGCTDAIATNYNADAEEDDGSCTYTVGCMDATATNYNSFATVDDGSCILPILGCTDSTATNYNPLATEDDGSCSYYLGCTDSTAYNYDPLAALDDGSCIYPPSVLKLSSITINEMPMTNNGATWDWDITGLTSDPDVFYVLKQGGGDIASSSSQDNISTFPISFTEDLPYAINNLSQEYTIYLYDSDVGGAELIGSCSFTPNDDIPTLLQIMITEINIQNDGVDMTLAIEWLP